MIGKIPFWAKEQLKLRRVFEAWISEEIDRYEKEGFQNLFRDREDHALDEVGGYTRSFVGGYCLGADRRIPGFMKQFRDDWLKGVTAAGHFYRGYNRNGHGDYITHTAEVFTQFLLNVLYLDMEDEKTVAIVDEAAGCLGNWHDDVQDFYDWDRNIFLSYFLGTESPYHKPPYDFQTPRHFRVLTIALAAYEATGNPRYLDLCTDYCDFWCREILEAEADADVPVHFYMIDPEAFEQFCKDRAFRESYRFGYYKGYRQAVSQLRGPETGLRDGTPCIPGGSIRDLKPPHHVLNDLVMTWLEVFKYAPEEMYRQVLRRVMCGWVGLGEDLVSQVAGIEPHCGVHLPKYRDFMADTSLDAPYLEQWPDGVCSYLLTGDEDRLLGSATASEAILTQTLLRNRGLFGDQFSTKHACNAMSVAGTTSAYVAPALFMPVFGGLNVHYGRAPWVNVLYYTDGAIGLPEDVAALYVPAVQGKGHSVKLANAGTKIQNVAVHPVNPLESGKLVLTAPAGLTEVTVKPGEVVEAGMS